MDETELIKIRLQSAAERRTLANEEYGKAITMAKVAGWSNTDIAREVGVSEAAIRAFWRRRTPPEARYVHTIV